MHKTTSVLHRACTPIYKSKRIVSPGIHVPWHPPWKILGPFLIRAGPGSRHLHIPKHLTCTTGYYPPATDFHDKISYKKNLRHGECPYNYIPYISGRGGTGRHEWDLKIQIQLLCHENADLLGSIISFQTLVCCDFLSQGVTVNERFFRPCTYHSPLESYTICTNRRQGF